MIKNKLIESIIKNRELLYALAVRDVVGRYKGSFVGIFWTFLNPALMLIVYTFVFSVVFKAKWNLSSDSKTEFALVLFAGLIVFNMFAECVTRAPTLILMHSNYVKKVIFPLEILPIVVVASSMFHAGVSFTVWLVAYVAFYGLPNSSVLLLPLVLLPLVLYLTGFVFVLAGLGVYFRDLSQLMNMVVTALMFLSPVFYPVASLPPSFQIVVNFNPISAIIESVRSVMFFGFMPEWEITYLNLLVSILCMMLGYKTFERLRKGFADVL